MEFARKYTLAAFGAAYLELALGIDGPSATLDRALAAAAEAEGIELVASQPI